MKHVRGYIETIPAATVELKHHWTMHAQRGWIPGRERVIVEALKADPTLDMHSDMTSFRCTNVAGLRALIR
eukprot:9345421-Pyramimonas_sp.AAC.1